MIGFIGCGNMGGALMGAMVAKGVCRGEELLVTDKVAAAMEDKHARYGATLCSTIGDVVARSKFVFLCVKPQDATRVMETVREAWAADNSQILISICAGVKVETLEACLPPGAKVVRVMPNTPCLVAEMAAGYSVNSNLTEADLDAVHKMLGAAGVVYRLPEALIDPVTGVSGSGPAYVAHLIDAFAKAGEKLGIPADVSYGLTLQTFIGTAELLRQKNMTPDELKKMVTSPNGTTYAGRCVLEASDVSEVIDCTVKATCDRAVELGAPAKK